MALGLENWQWKLGKCTDEFGAAPVGWPFTGKWRNQLGLRAKSCTPGKSYAEETFWMALREGADKVGFHKIPFWAG
jgi:hypothetical protein